MPEIHILLFYKNAFMLMLTRFSIFSIYATYFMFNTEHLEILKNILKFLLFLLFSVLLYFSCLFSALISIILLQTKVK